MDKEKWNADDYATPEEINSEIERLDNALSTGTGDSMELRNRISELKVKLEHPLDESRLPRNPEKDPEFGIPEEKKYPLFDRQHVINAIKLFGHVEPKYEAALAHRIIRKMREYNVGFDMIGKDNKLYNYIPETEKLEENYKQAYRDGGEKYEKYIAGKETAYRMRHPDADKEEASAAAEKNYDSWSRKKNEKTDPDGQFQKAYRDGGKEYTKLISNNSKKIRISGSGSEELTRKMRNVHRTEVGRAEGQFRKYQSRFDTKDDDDSLQEAEHRESADPKITKCVNMLRSDLQDEFTAIKNYDIHVDACETAGLPDIAKVLRDIRDEEKVHVGELQSILKQHDPEFEKSLNDGEEEVKELHESVLDPVHKERCQELWDGDKLKPAVKAFILDTLNEFLKQTKFDINVTAIYLLGSSTGYQYTDTSDIDCNVEIDRPFKDAAERHEFVKTIPNGHNVPGTQHPVNYFFLTEFQEKNAENIYELNSDTWLKKSPKEASVLPTGYILELSKFFMHSLDLTFSEYARDKQEYLEYKAMDPLTLEISEKEKAEAMDKKLTEIKSDLDALRIGNHVIRGFLHEAYDSEDNQYIIHIEIENPNKDPRKSINNLVYKCLEKFGYRTKLEGTIAEAEEFIAAESPSEQKEGKNADSLQEAGWEQNAEHDVYTWKAPDGTLVRYYDEDEREEVIKQWHEKHDTKGNLKEEAEVLKKFEPLTDRNISILQDAVFSMSKIKRGALIVILGKDNIFKNGAVIQPGTDINWNIDKKKILDMFIVGTPLHDGAAVISGNKMIKGAVFVEPTLSKVKGKFGARHQATQGISENSDSIAIIVSEETGKVSVAFDGKLEDANENNFKKLLKKDFEKIERNKGKGCIVVRKITIPGKNVEIDGKIYDKKDNDEIEGSDARISGNVIVNPTKGTPLKESVTFIDNAGNLKTMSAENYNKDMHEYHSNYQIKRFRISKNKTYKLRDDE